MLETDPVTIALVDGDWSFSNGLVLLAAGLDAVVIGAETRMRLVYGEWILNRRVGVRWFANDLVPPVSAILGERYNEVRLRSELRGAILRTPSIVEILRLQTVFDVATRTATVTWSARSEFGDTDLNVLEIAP